MDSSELEEKVWGVIFVDNVVVATGHTYEEAREIVRQGDGRDIIVSGQVAIRLADRMRPLPEDEEQSNTSDNP